MIPSTSAQEQTEDSSLPEGARHASSGPAIPERRKGESSERLCALEWACGDDATAALRELVARAVVRCDVLGHDRWSRGLGVCFADAVELNREMVRQGWALAYYPERGAELAPVWTGHLA
jgi:endonuclease YncB( thermonuclease family)